MPDSIDMRCQWLDDTGRGVAEVDGVQVHVTDLLPGETASVRIEARSRHHPKAHGRITQRLSPLSPDRVSPRCPAFGRCGGCRWQHLAYPAQLAEKHKRLQSVLGPLLPAGVAVAPVVASASPWHYRNKGAYIVARAQGTLTLGAYEPRSHRVVDTRGCRVVTEAIDQLATTAATAIGASALEPYDESTGSGTLRYLIVRHGSDDRLLVGVVTRSDADPAAVEALAVAVAENRDVGGVVWIKNDATSSALLSDAITPLVGTPTLAVEFSGLAMPAAVGSFLQVNTAQAEVLYRAVTAAAEVTATTRAVDLYCGLGGIGLALAAAGAEVLCIDRSPDARIGEAAVAGSALARRPRFVAANADEVHSHVSGSPDVVVVNPPRKGLSGSARAAVADLRPGTLIYVSCGPDSLARDLADFAHRGYTVDLVVPFDLMPGTAQVETLVRLRGRPRT